jgi:Ca2+-binding EF-hand superfamily protein
MALKEIELQVPTTLSDIKLWQYQKYMKIIEQNKTEDAEDEEKINDFLNMKLVEIFCNVSLRDVSTIPLKYFNEILEILNKAFEEKPKLVQRFKLLDVDMGFIPKLDDITLGEYVDIETNISDWQKMHKAMAVLYRPVNFKAKDKYTIAPYKVNEEIQELMKEMPLDVAISSMVFFYDLGKDLLGVIPKYLEQRLKKEDMQQLETHLQKSGVGINQFMHSLKVMSETSMQLPNFHSTNV